jgi:DNA-binding MarR family transcriptional regulator
MNRESVFAFESPDDSPGFLLWQVTNLWRRKMNAALRKADLTHVQFVLLAGLEWLSYHHEHVTQVQLAAHAKTDVMMTSNVLRSLEAKGLVTRQVHPTDTRAKCLALTEAGRNTLQTTVQIVDQVDSDFFCGLECQGQAFNAMLKDLIEQNGTTSD